MVILSLLFSNPSALESLYFVAIVPPEPVYAEVMNMKIHISEQYKSKAALKSPPHITLHMPFKWKEAKVERLCQAMEMACEATPPFNIELDGFGAFEPRVIYVSPVDNERMTHLYQQVQHAFKGLYIFNADYKGRGFHPHMTIAFRDLKKNLFYEAWGEFEHQHYARSFAVQDLCLLRHDGQCWEIYKRFALAE